MDFNNYSWEVQAIPFTDLVQKLTKAHLKITCVITDFWLKNWYLCFFDAGSKSELFVDLKIYKPSLFSER